MMKHGLIDVFNLPLTDQSKLIKYKDCRRTLKEKIEGIRNKPAEENFSKSIRKWKLPEIEMLNKKPMITSMMEVRLTSLNNEPHNKMMEAVMDTNEHMIVEELWYKIEDTYFTRTKIVLHTEVIRTTSTEEMMDHG